MALAHPLRKLPLLLALALAAPATFAINLAEAYQAALSNDATIRAQRAATESQRERVPQARSQLLPQVGASAQQSRNWLEQTAPDFMGRPTTNESTYNSGNRTLTVRQALFRPAALANLRQAEALVESAEAQLERENQNLVMRVTGAYFDALLAEEQLGLIQVQRRTYETQVDAARKGFAAGAGTRTDIDEAQARLDLTIAQELEAQQQVQFARHQLQTIIGQRVDSVAPIDVNKLALVPPTPNDLGEWLARATGFSPEVQQLRAQLLAASEEVRKAQAGHLPTLDAIAQWQRSKSENITRIDTEFDQKLIGVQLNVPIYQGGLVNSQVRQALAEVERARNALEALQLDLSVRVHREFRGVTEGVARVRALEQAVRSNEQLVTSSRRSFQAGSRTLVDILNAEQQLSTARRDLARARFEYLVARARLRALAGEMKPSNIDEINGWLQH